MGPAQTYALAYLFSGVLLLGLAILFFLFSKRGAKKFLRVVVQENSSSEDEYRMLRGLVGFLVAGALFLIFAIWGTMRLLDVNQWVSVLGS